MDNPMDRIPVSPQAQLNQPLPQEGASAVAGTTEHTATTQLPRQTNGSGQEKAIGDRAATPVEVTCPSFDEVPPGQRQQFLEANLQVLSMVWLKVSQHNKRNFAEALKNYWDLATSDERNTIAQQCCANLIQGGRLIFHPTLASCQVDLFAIGIVNNPSYAEQCQAQIPKPEEVFETIYITLKPDTKTLDEITFYLNKFFQQTGRLPSLCQPWGFAYAQQYPEMLSKWVTYFGFDPGDTTHLQAILCKPFEQLEQGNVQWLIAKVTCEKKKTFYFSLLNHFTRTHSKVMTTNREILTPLVTFVQDELHKNNNGFQRFSGVKTFLQLLAQSMAQGLGNLESCVQTEPLPGNIPFYIEYWHTLFSQLDKLDKINIYRYITKSDIEPIWRPFKKEVGKARVKALEVTFNLANWAGIDFWKTLEEPIIRSLYSTREDIHLAIKPLFNQSPSEIQPGTIEKLVSFVESTYSGHNKTLVNLVLAHLARSHPEILCRQTEIFEHFFRLTLIMISRQFDPFKSSPMACLLLQTITSGVLTKLDALYEEIGKIRSDEGINKALNQWHALFTYIIALKDLALKALPEAIQQSFRLELDRMIKTSDIVSISLVSKTGVDFLVKLENVIETSHSRVFTRQWSNFDKIVADCMQKYSKKIITEPEALSSATRYLTHYAQRNSDTFLNKPNMMRLCNTLLRSTKIELDRLQKIFSMGDSAIETEKTIALWKRMFSHLQALECADVGEQYCESQDMHSWETQKTEIDLQLQQATILANTLGQQLGEHFWGQLDEKTIIELKQLGMNLLSGSRCSFYKPCHTGTVFDLIKEPLIRQKDVRAVAEHLKNRLSERNLMVIIARSSTEHARIFLQSHCISLECLAEICRYHPEILITEIEKGTFSSREALPELVKLAETFPQLSELIQQEQYLHQLTPSWLGKLAALNKGLALSTWKAFQDQTYDELRGTEKEQWLEALKHISHHTDIAILVQRWAIEKDVGDVVYACVCHHPEQITSEVVQYLKTKKYCLYKLSRLHGSLAFQGLNPEEIKGHLSSEAICRSPELADLVPEDHKIATAAKHWRNRAEALVNDTERYHSLKFYHKDMVLKTWPFLKTLAPESPDVAFLTLEESFSMLQDERTWPSLCARKLYDACRNFPAIAEPVLLDPKFKKLLAKLSEDQQWAMCLHHECVARKKIAEGLLSHQQECELYEIHRYLMDEIDDEAIKRFNADELSRILSKPGKCMMACRILIAQRYREIRKPLQGAHWCAIAQRQAEVSLNLLHPDCMEWNKLSTLQVKEIAEEQEPFLRALLSQKNSSRRQALGITPGSWFDLAVEHPDCFELIYTCLKNDGHQEATEPKHLLRYQGNRTLWPKILATVPTEDRQWLNANSSPALPLARFIEPDNNFCGADFHDFSQSYWPPKHPGIYEKGCCSGFVLDFVRFARKSDNPSAYTNKIRHLHSKKWSASPYRIDYLQRNQRHYITAGVRIYDPQNNPNLTLDLEKPLLTLENEKALYLTSANHATALILKQTSTSTADLYYFDPNWGVWRWREFDRTKDANKLGQVIADTLLETGTGECWIKQHEVKNLSDKVLPPKRKRPLSLPIPDPAKIRKH